MRKQLKFQVLALVALIPAMVIVYLSQKYMAQVDPILRVINLLGTLIHEGGHSVMALITGGYLGEMVVNPDGSGYAAIGGGNFFFILPAGYLSTTLLTALMFLVNNRTRWGEVIPFILGLVLGYLTFMYGAKLAGGTTTIVVGYVCSAFLLYIGIHPTIRIPGTQRRFEFPDWAWMFVVNLISMYYTIGGILSLEYISRHGDYGNSDDISRFAEMYFPSIHPTTMAAILMWLSIGVWVIVFFVVGVYLYRRFKSGDEKLM